MLARRLTPVVALALSACFNFQNPTLVIDRRILGMAAQPPELIYSVSDFTQPIQVSALVVDPTPNSTPQTFTWSWCLPDLNQQGAYDPDSGRCIEEPSSLVSQGAVPLSQMGTSFDPQTALNALLAFAGGSSTNLISALAGLNAPSTTGTTGTSTPAPTDDLSTYLMFMLDVEGDADSKGDLYGIVRVVLSTPGPGDRQPNHNPHMTGLLFDDQIWGPDEPLQVKLKSCSVDQQVAVSDPAKGNQQVLVCQHRVMPVYDPSQDETYQVQQLIPDAQGVYQVLTLQETLTFNWFSNSGTFSSAFTGTQSNLAPQVHDPFSTEWIEPPELPASSTMTLWVIFQDDRGGESWEIRQLALSE